MIAAAVHKDERRGRSVTPIGIVQAQPLGYIELCEGSKVSGCIHQTDRDGWAVL
jgi:hypothetical protein